MITFFAHGLPVPQGSTRAFVVKGRPVITSTAKGLAAWRRLIADAAQAHARMHEGAVVLGVDFYLPRPKSAPKRKPIHASKRPDIDKLLRAILDSLSGVMYRDDAQVVRVNVSKGYARPDGRIGVEVRIYEAGEELAS